MTLSCRFWQTKIHWELIISFVTFVEDMSENKLELTENQTFKISDSYKNTKRNEENENETNNNKQSFSLQ